MSRSGTTKPPGARHLQDGGIHLQPGRAPLLAARPGREGVQAQLLHQRKDVEVGAPGPPSTLTAALLAAAHVVHQREVLKQVRLAKAQ